MHERISVSCKMLSKNTLNINIKLILFLQQRIAPYLRNIQDKSRLYFVNTTTAGYRTVCFSEKNNFAIFEAVDNYLTVGKSICKLVPVGESHFNTWIGSGVKRGYPYKRSLDLGYKILFLCLIFNLYNNIFSTKLSNNIYNNVEVAKIDSFHSRWYC